MTEREQKLLAHLLNILHEADGGLYDAITLHGDVYLRAACSLGEFNAVLAIAAQRGWINTIENRTTKKLKYNISDAGEAARLEM